MAADANPVGAGQGAPPPALAFDDGVVRQFTIMTIVWGIVGMLVGVLLAAQLAWPQLNFDNPYLSFGRPVSPNRSRIRLIR